MEVGGQAEQLDAEGDRFGIFLTHEQLVELEELFEDNSFQYTRVSLVVLLSHYINLIHPLDLIDQTKEFLNLLFHLFTQNPLFPLKNTFHTLNQPIVKMFSPIVLTHKALHLVKTVVGIGGVAHFQG